MSLPTSVSEVFTMDGGYDALSSNDADFPATHAQTRLFRAEQGRGAQQLAARYRVVGALSEVALRRALQALVKRHEILRTYFVERDGAVYQRVVPALELAVSVADLQHLPLSERAAEAESQLSADALVAFDLASGPLLRAMSVRLEPELQLLQLTFQRTLIDDGSLAILTRELGTLLAAYEAGTACVLPQIDLHFGDYARWQGDVLDSGALEAEREYWQAQLYRLPRLHLRGDVGAGATATSQNLIERVSRSLEPELATLLEGVVQKQSPQHGSTLFTLALAALSAVLQRATGADEIALATTVPGRDLAAAAAVVGRLSNSLIVRLDTSRNPTLRDLVAHANDVYNEALAHRQIPFEVLLAEFEADASSGFTAVSAHLGQRSRLAEARYGSLTLQSLPSSPTGPQWDLDFTLLSSSDGYSLVCEADPEQYSSSFVARLLELWKSALVLIATTPELRMHDLPTPVLAHTVERSSEVGLKAIPPAPKQAARARNTRKPTNPRLAALAERIIAIREEGDETPVMVVNNTAVLFPLARALGENRPVYDLQLCPSDEPLDLPYRDFRDLARDVVEMVRLARPQGPYILVGLCVFGNLALEAARQLRAEGETVELVVLNDSLPPGYREDMPWLKRQMHAWRVRAQDLELDVQRIQRGERTAGEVIASYTILRQLKLVQLGAKLHVLRPSVIEDVRRLENRWFTDYCLHSQSYYRPAPYDGDVLILRSEEASLGHLYAADLGWDYRITGRVNALQCPGMHAEMFRVAGSEVMAKAIIERTRPRR